jgi:hypothetical protein
MILDVKKCILFIIQDMQEGDMFCGRFGTHTLKVQRQCRVCNVNYDDLDKLTDPCRYVYAGPMAQIAACPNAHWTMHIIMCHWQTPYVAFLVRRQWKPCMHSAKA